MNNKKGSHCGSLTECFESRKQNKLVCYAETQKHLRNKHAKRNGELCEDGCP